MATPSPDLADEEQQVGVAGEVHGEQEEGELLHHGDAALVRQREGQRLHLRGLLGGRGLRVQRGAGPLGRPPQPDQVLKVLRDRGTQGAQRTSSSPPAGLELTKMSQSNALIRSHSLLCTVGLIL